MSFGVQPPANLGEGVAATDTDIFSAEYLFGQHWPTEEAETSPGAAAILDAAPLTEPEPAYLADAPNEQPQQTNPSGGNGTWYTWDGTQPLRILLPNGSDIRSIWIPTGQTQAISIVPGNSAGGGGALRTTQGNTELVPLATGIPVATLIASAPFSAPIQVYATSDVLSPSAATPAATTPGLTGLQESDGASHLYLLNDAASGVAIDKIGGENGQYSALGVLPVPSLIIGNLSATHFDGANGVLLIPIAEELSGDFSLEWVGAQLSHSIDSSATLEIISTSAWAGKGFKVEKGFSTTCYSWNLATTTGNYSVRAANFTADGEIHHWVVTFSSIYQTIVIYKDGVPVQTGSVTGLPALDNSDPFIRIAYNAAISTYGHANLDMQNFATYNAALSQLQVKNHYLAALG